VKFRIGMILIVGLALITLSGCSAPAAQPLSFNPAPWSDGEVSTYDLRDRNAASIGTATWTWREDPGSGQWIQGYALDINGRSDRGEVVMGKDLRPMSSWREMSGQRFATTYAADAITILTTAADGKVTTKTLKPTSDGIDNDQSLQVQRALPLAAGYATRYTDVIPTTGLISPVRISVTGAETITVPAGDFPTWHTVLDYGSGKHDAWYGQQVPYPLVRYVNRASGAAFELRSITGSEDTPAPAALTAQPEAPVPSGPPPLNVPFLLSSVLIQYPLMIFFPLVLGWWIRRRYRVGWGIFWAGAATFILSQIVHLPLNWALGLLGGGRGVALWPLAALALVAGLSAALCEEGARWIVLTFFLKRCRRWDQGLQYGAGHGGVEAIIFGVLALISFISMIALRFLDPAVLNLAGAAAEQVQAQMTQYWATPWYMSILGGLERVFAITLQIAMALLVVRSVARRQLLYLLAAIGLHTAVDFWAVWGMGTLGMVWVEVGVAVFGAFAFWLILRLKEPSPAPEVAPIPSPTITAVDLTPRTLSAEELAHRAESSKYE
jgi:uncharacterized membrane protein YhfC